MAKPPSKPRKRATLRQQGALNPHPDRVRDRRFEQSAFFDPYDLVQVKYEMLRCVNVDHESISDVAARYGLSRVSFYHAQRLLDEEGLPGLIPKRRGPREGHKLTDEVMRFVQELQLVDRALSSSAIAERVADRFGVTVHPRTVERALASRKKKRQ